MWYFSLHVEHEEVSQQIKNLSNKIQLGQRGVVTLRKTLNEVEAQISDLDAAKEIAKRGNDQSELEATCNRCQAREDKQPLLSAGKQANKNM